MKSVFILERDYLNTLLAEEWMRFEKEHPEKAKQIKNLIDGDLAEGETRPLSYYNDHYMALGELRRRAPEQCIGSSEGAEVFRLSVMYVTYQLMNT